MPISLDRNVDFGDILTPEVKEKHNGKTIYELVGNILHDGTPEKGTYRCHVLHKPTQQWWVYLTRDTRRTIVTLPYRRLKQITIFGWYQAKKPPNHKLYTKIVFLLVTLGPQHQQCQAQDKLYTDNKIALECISLNDFCCYRYEMQDLHVTSILPQMITLTEAYIQIYELKQDWLMGIN